MLPREPTKFSSYCALNIVIMETQRVSFVLLSSFRILPNAVDNVYELGCSRKSSDTFETMWRMLMGLIKTQYVTENSVCVCYITDV